jgi:hypothetical protein
MKIFSKQSILILSLSILGVSFFLKEDKNQKLPLYKPAYFFEKQSNFSPLDTTFDPSILGSKKFTYLGQGLQSVAFENEDKTIVLKFFIKNKIRSKSHQLKASLNFFSDKSRKQDKKKNKLKKLIQNYAMYFDKLQEHSSVIAIQSGQFSTEPLIVELIDPEFKAEKIDLNQYAFVIQKKADLFLDKIQSQTTLEDKKAYVQLMKEFLKKRAENGFTDVKRTMSMEKNYGFIGELPVQFDIGNVINKPQIEKSPEDEIQEITALFDLFLKNNGLNELVSSD